MPAMFAIKRNEYGLVPVVLLEGRNIPSELMTVETIDEAKEDARRLCGEDVLYVSYRLLQSEVQHRAVHTPEIVHLLEQYGCLRSCMVYGAPMRPMSASWARIEDAVYIDADKPTTGYHTYVVVPADLDQAIADRYELVFVSRGK